MASDTPQSSLSSTLYLLSVFLTRELIEIVALLNMLKMIHGECVL